MNVRKNTSLPWQTSLCFKTTKDLPRLQNPQQMSLKVQISACTVGGGGGSYYYRPQTKLRRLCFYTCLSFCPHGGGFCPSACWNAHGPRDQRQTPPPPRDQRQTPPPRPEADPLGPEAYTPPRCHACWEIRATSGRYVSY